MGEHLHCVLACCYVRDVLVCIFAYFFEMCYSEYCSRLPGAIELPANLETCEISVLTPGLDDWHTICDIDIKQAEEHRQRVAKRFQDTRWVIFGPDQESLVAAFTSRLSLSVVGMMAPKSFFRQMLGDADMRSENAVHFCLAKSNKERDWIANMQKIYEAVIAEADVKRLKAKYEAAQAGAQRESAEQDHLSHPSERNAREADRIRTEMLLAMNGIEYKEASPGIVIIRHPIQNHEIKLGLRSGKISINNVWHRMPRELVVSWYKSQTACWPTCSRCGSITDFVGVKSFKICNNTSCPGRRAEKTNWDGMYNRLNDEQKEPKKSRQS
jgi:hypothetical protein